MARVMGWSGAAFLVAGTLLAFGTSLTGLAWTLVGAGAVLAVVALVMSVRRWSPTKGGDPVAQQAEARLWSTLNSNRR